MFEPPWSLRIEDRAPLTVMLMVRGHAWIMPEEGERVRLRAGDLAIARTGSVHLRRRPVDRAPGGSPNQLCTYPDGRSLKGRMDLGVGTWARGSTARW